MPRLQDPELGPFPGTRWTVLEVGLRAEPSPSQVARGWQGNRAASVRCVCGTESVIRLKSLLSGGSTQCAICQLRERGRTGAAVHYPDAHGLSRHLLYGTWVMMMDRCYNLSSNRYHCYGGRRPYPITVCPRWHDVRAFILDIERLLGPRPEGCTLDRIRNGLGYKPSNVRWADDHTQRANRGKSWWEMSVAEQLAQGAKWKQEQLALRGAA